MVPLLINCWPSASGGESYVNIEYESTTDFDLQNVAIAIPLPALAASPKVNQVCLPARWSDIALLGHMLADKSAQEMCDTGVHMLVYSSF